MAPITAFGIKKIKQARCAVPVGVFADIAGLLRLIEISRAIEADDLIVGAQIFKRVPYIRQHLSACELLLLLCLRNGKAGARDLSLVAIEDRQLDLPEERNVVQRADVRVADLARDVSFADGLLQFVLAVRGGHSLLRARRSGLVCSAFA